MVALLGMPALARADCTSGGVRLEGAADGPASNDPAIMVTQAPPVVPGPPSGTPAPATSDQPSSDAAIDRQAAPADGSATDGISRERAPDPTPDQIAAARDCPQ